MGGWSPPGGESGFRTVAHRSLGHRPGSTAKERPLAPAQVSPSSFGAAEHDPYRRLAALVTRAPWHRQESALGSPASRLFPAFLFSSVHHCIKQGSEQGHSPLRIQRRIPGHRPVHPRFEPPNQTDRQSMCSRPVLEAVFDARRQSRAQLSRKAPPLASAEVPLPPGRA